jgi:YHS domain-containing protein
MRHKSHDIHSNQASLQALDPVCGMTVDEATDFKLQLQGKNYLFCSLGCLQYFLGHSSHRADSNGGELMSIPKTTESPLKTYFPLILILVYLCGGVGLSEMSTGSIDLGRMMAHFMGGFFLIFAFFKLLNLRGFVDSYRTYDILSRLVPVYGWVYPFIELSLGVCYWIGWKPFVTNWITLMVMSLSSAGVARALIKKSRIQCACLGTVINLPMTEVTLFEDLLMVGMALANLLWLGQWD